MKSYFAYIRVSTVKQGEHGSSLQEQKSAIEAYAQRHGHQIAEWFEETETAAKQGRREFNRLTNLLRKGKASGVIIHKIDRSARNLKDWAGLGELIDAGVEVLFAHEGLDMQTRGGRLAADIQAVVAADFIRNLRDEVRKGFYGRLKQGLYPLPAPRGYVDEGKGRPKSIDPVKGPLVRQAFELYATGAYSLERLRNELFERGLSGPTGKVLSFNALATMLHNPFYAGLIRIYKTDETFEGIHPPIVAMRTYERVQAVLFGRQYPRLEKHEFLFRRLVRCERCGRCLTGERQKGRVYYRCHDRGCRSVSLSETAIDAFIVRELASIQLTDEDLRDFRDLLASLVLTEQGERQTASETITRDLALVDERLSRLTDAVIDGIIDKAAFDERKARLLAQKRRVQDQLGDGLSLPFWSKIVGLFERGLVAQQGYISGNVAEKRQMVELVSSNFLVRGKYPLFTMNFPFDEVANWSKTINGEPYRGAVRTRTLIDRLEANRHRRLDDPLKSPSSPQVHQNGCNGSVALTYRPRFVPDTLPHT